jgi:hypothetical protein
MNSKSTFVCTTKQNIRLLVFLVFVALIINSKVISAQEKVSIRQSGYTAEKQAGGQTTWLTHALNLDKELSEKVYKINMKYLLTVDSVRMSNTGKVDKRDIYLSITKRMNAEMQSVLSPEQYSIYLSFSGNAKVKTP